MILAGDIGGTNSRLAIFSSDLQKQEEKFFRNAGRARLQDIIAEFLAPLHYPLETACFAVAGPVAAGAVTMINLSWHLDEIELAKEFNIPRVTLINDLRGHAEGIEVLSPDQFITLHPGEIVKGGGRAVIAAGTGLGEAGLAFDAKTGRYLSFPTEGGHADFSPTNEEEDDLLQFMRRRVNRVYWETVLSGRGMRNLYDFYCDSGKYDKSDELPDNPAWAGAGPDPKSISDAALAGTSPVAVAAVDLFARLYGSEAGNFALKTLATSGVYLGGGIAPKIAAKLQNPAVVKAFISKGSDKMEAVMRKIPLHIINFEFCGLYGAANYARNM